MFLNHTHLIITLVCIISQTVSANENSQLYVPCEPGWYLFGDNCYNIFCPKSKLNDGCPLDRADWDDSKDSCVEYGGHLASIHSNQLQEFLTVFLLLNVKSDVWIGLHDRARRRNETDLAWEDGSIFNYSNWDSNEPSLKFNYVPYCSVMLYKKFRDGIGKWKRITCRHVLPSICQVNKNDDKKSPDPRFCSLEDGGGWKYLNSCYHIIEEKKSWEEAEKYCEEKYKGNLATIPDHDSEVFLEYIQKLSNFTEVWIGIKMRNNTMQKWASGWHVDNKKLKKERLTFVNGTCVLVLGQNYWAVAPCLNKHPFICEKIKYNTVVPVLKRPPSDDWKCPDSSKTWLDLEGEYCYYIETEKSRKWFEANNECGKIGGTLASFHSEDETNILYPHVINTQERLLIGLIRISLKKDGFKWADGTDLIYENWDVGQPYYWDRGGCGDLSTETMKWKVIPCHSSKGYICKSKKVLLKIEEISTPVPCTSADSKDQTYSGGMQVGTVFGIVFCFFLFQVVGFLLYHYRNVWKRYCMKTKNDELTSTAPDSLGHVSEKVTWMPLKEERR